MKNIFSKELKIGILGGGQLGKMLLQKAADFNLSVNILDSNEEAPCRHLCNEFTQGSVKDFDTVYNFGKDLDIISIELEDVNADALEKLEREGKKVYPQPSVLKMIQDKGLQKQFYKKNNLPTSPFVLIENKDEIANADIDFPVFQKLRRSGYDGYGVQSLKNRDDLENALDGSSLLEKAVEMEKELSVIVARSADGEIKHFPPVALEYNEENMVDFLFAPAGISENRSKEAIELAETTIEKMGLVGLLAVEMFLSKNGELMINEVAPRPHNSGHQTIEGNITSQFEQHLRAILNLPLGDTTMRSPSVMVNILGAPGHRGKAVYKNVQEVLKMKGVYIHLYGKYETRPFRKMGHVTIISDKLEDAVAKARKVKEILRVVAE